MLHLRCLSAGASVVTELQLSPPCLGAGNHTGGVRFLPSALELQPWAWSELSACSSVHAAVTENAVNFLRKCSTCKPLAAEGTSHTFGKGSPVFPSPRLTQPCSGRRVPCWARGQGEGQREDGCLPSVCSREILQKQGLPSSYINYSSTANPFFSLQMMMDFCTHHQENPSAYFECANVKQKPVYNERWR